MTRRELFLFVVSMANGAGAVANYRAGRDARALADAAEALCAPPDPRKDGPKRFQARDAKWIAKVLDESIRQGAETDQPEGARYIVLSDTLARSLADLLRDVGDI